MKTTFIKHTWSHYLTMAIVAMSWAAFPAMHAQSDRKTVGEIADTFQLTNIRTGNPFDLAEAEGSIILLDFFFYW